MTTDNIFLAAAIEAVTGRKWDSLESVDIGGRKKVLMKYNDSDELPMSESLFVIWDKGGTKVPLLSLQNDKNFQAVYTKRKNEIIDMIKGE